MNDKSQDRNNLEECKVVKLIRPEPLTWMQMAKRLHKDGHKGFGRVCFSARLSAQEIAFPRDETFFALISNMELLKQSPFWLDYTINKIEEIYYEAYPIPTLDKSFHLADIIPFPMSVQKGGK